MFYRLWRYLTGDVARPRSRGATERRQAEMEMARLRGFDV